MSHDSPPPLQGDFFSFGNLDVLRMFPEAPHSPGIPAADSIADALHLDPGGVDNDDDGTMTLLDGSMMDAFADDMAMNIDPMPSVMDGDGDEMDNDMMSQSAMMDSETPYSLMTNDMPGTTPMAVAHGSASSSGSNRLTEFTKRRNWPAKVIDEIRDLLQILDDNGRIRYVSPSITSLAGYTTEEIQDTFLKDLVHPDDQGVLVSELNECIASGVPLRMFYRMKKKDGTYAMFEVVGHAHIAAARFAPNPNNMSPFCQAMFMMARLYPTKNAALLDSFLEHKIENERLRRRIAELRREEEAEVEEAQRQWSQGRDARPSLTASQASGLSSATILKLSNDAHMPSTLVDGALTKKNLEDITASSRQDSLRDKMARFEASSADTIALLTGIVNGERMASGNRSPTLIKGDAGIAIPLDRDSRSGEKKKKQKMAAEEYVCTDCGMHRLSRLGKMATNMKWQALLILQNGEKDPTGPKRSATPVDYDGRRRRRSATAAARR